MKVDLVTQELSNMKNFAIKKPLTKNQVDDLTDALVNVMRYSDPTVEYPSFDKAKSDDGVIAEWLYPIFNGTNDFSELTAIHMYTTQEATFDEIGELLLGIAITEMKHYDKLADFIRKIGGKIDQKFNNSGVTIGKTSDEALRLAIGAEEKTIDFYEKLEEKLLKLDETTTIKIALQLLAKLLADEVVHLKLLKEKLKTIDKDEM